jgi:hypothetical protein
VPVAPPPAARPAASPSKSPRSLDALGELEKLRKQAMQAPAAAPAPGKPAVSATPPAGTNGRGELSRTIEMTLKRADFSRARRFLVSFQVEDDQNQIVDAVRDLRVDIKDASSLEKLLLRLNIALNAKE